MFQSTWESLYSPPYFLLSSGRAGSELASTREKHFLFWHVGSTNGRSSTNPDKIRVELCKVLNAGPFQTMVVGILYQVSPFSEALPWGEGISSDFCPMVKAGVLLWPEF